MLQTIYHHKILTYITIRVIRGKKALRETQIPRALAVVRFGHRPPATNTQTHRQDRLQYTALLASAQCKYEYYSGEIV